MNKDKSKETETTEKSNPIELIRIGTWNIRSIKGKEVELVEEMIKHRIEILGITETKKKGEGIRRIHKGYWIFWSGVEEKERAKGGVGLIISPNRLKDINKEKYVNERIISIEINLIKKEAWTLIVAYGENEDAKKEDKDKFYDNLQREIDDGTENVIIMGDLNGRVGNQNVGIEEYMGKEGEEVRNNNGERIIQLSVENNLIIANTKFKHRNIHKYTRVQPSRNEKSIIDYYLISKNKWQIVKNIKVTRQAEIGSDHYLVKMELVRKSEGKTDKRRRKVKEKIRTYKLKEPENREQYQETVKRKYIEQPKQIGVEEKWEVFKNILLQAAKESCGT